MPGDLPRRVKARSAPAAAAILVALLLAPLLSYSFEEVSSSSSSSPRSPIRFTDVTKASGITFKYEADLRHGRNLATMGGGVAMGDFDGDGYPTSSSSAGRERKKPEAVCAAPSNRGDGTFEDVTARLSSGPAAGGWGVSVDVDGEGRLDLVDGVGGAELWKNLERNVPGRRPRAWPPAPGYW